MTVHTRLRFIVINGDEQRVLDTVAPWKVDPPQMASIAKEFHSITEERGAMYALVDFLSEGDFIIEENQDLADYYWSYALAYDNQMDDPLFSIENRNCWKEQNRLSEWDKETIENEVL